MFECLSASGVVAAALIAPPGPDVIAALSPIHPASLRPQLQVDLLIAWERQAGWVAAVTQPVLACVGDFAQADAEAHLHKGDENGLAMRAAHSEIAAALRLSDVTAANRLQTARALVRQLPNVTAALAAGDISYWHAHAIAEATDCLDQPKAVAVADRVLKRAGRQTVADLRRCLRRAVLAADPSQAAERAEQAQQGRRVELSPLDDAMAELRLIASAADTLRLFNTIDAHARTLPKRDADGAHISLDNRRADALIDLICTDRQSRPGRTPTVTLNVTLDLPTLLGLRDHPGELAGYGPIPAPAARALAADAAWRRLIHDPLTGHLLDLGHTSYKPSAALTRYIHTRDQVCAFAGCNRPAVHCDIDHNRRYDPTRPDGGRTDRNNTKPFCKTHHRLKHETGWTARQDPITAHTIWTSPTSHHYFIAPFDYRTHHGIENDPPLPDTLEHQLNTENPSRLCGTSASTNSRSNDDDPPPF